MSEESTAFLSRCKVIDQNVNAEIQESSNLFTVSWILIAFYLSVFLATRKIQGSVLLPARNLTNTPQKDHKSFKMEYSLKNFSSENIYGLLRMKVIPSISALASGAKLNNYKCVVHSIDYGLNNTIERERDTRFLLPVHQNSSWSTVHFSRLNNYNEIYTDITCEVGRIITDDVLFQWEIGSPAASQLACYINLMMLVLMGLGTIVWFTQSKGFKWSVRVRFMSVIIPASFVAHIPLDLFIDVRIARLILYVIQCIIFGIYIVFWRLKSIGFDVDRAKKASEFKPIMLAMIMTIVLVMRGITRELDLYSFPLLFDASYAFEQEFMSKNLVQVVVGFTFYTLLTEYLDRFDKMESEEQGPFLADNFVTFFAMLMNSYVYMTMAKERNPVENPVTRAVIAVLWDCVTLYEIYGSRPVTVIDEEQEGYLNADVISDEGEINV